MSALRRVHLLSADEALTEGYRYQGTYIAVCGKPIDASSLLGASGPDGSDCEVTYCLGCLDGATECNRETGVEVGCPPGIIVMTGSQPGIRR